MSYVFASLSGEAVDCPEMDSQEGVAFGPPLPVSATPKSSFDFATMSPRRFPSPWQVEQTPGGFKVLDASGQALVYVYARETREQAVLLTEE